MSDNESNNNNNNNDNNDNNKNNHHHKHFTIDNHNTNTTSLPSTPRLQRSKSNPKKDKLSHKTTSHPHSQKKEHLHHKFNSLYEENGKEDHSKKIIQSTTEPNLHKAMSEFDIEELKKFIEELQKTFKKSQKHQLQQLQQLQNFFENHIHIPIPEIEETKSDQLNPNFPLALVDPKIKTLVKTFLRLYPQTILGKSLSDLIGRFTEIFISFENKSVSDLTSGIKVLIQIMINAKSTVLRDHLLRETIIKSFLTKYESFPKKIRIHFLSELVWCLSQFIEKDPGSLLSAWLEFILPILDKTTIPAKSLFQLTELFQRLLKSNSFEEMTKRLVQDVVSAKFFAKYILITDNISFAIKTDSVNERVHKTTLKKSAQLDKKYRVDAHKILSEILPQLEKISIFFQQESQHLYFENILAISLAKASKSSLFSYLVQILERDSKTFEEWKRCYSTLIPQSSKLIKYIYTNWNNLKNKISTKEMLQLLHYFQRTNLEIINGIFHIENDKNGIFNQQRIGLIQIKGCTNYCNLLEKRITNKLPISKFKLFLSIMILFIIIAIFAVYRHFSTSIFVFRKNLDFDPKK
ncbi:transmembrane protein [Anaeramoeba ignava]|uniref:Transmembrane protein n=1 Tax=Anaeramoeba ignava TaxID=1746090 RepID=A0A9Q0L8Q4_ANAIG|nr:transmembrane protein [Anaeramoeba ignava]